MKGPLEDIKAKIIAVLKEKIKTSAIEGARPPKAMM